MSTRHYFFRTEMDGSRNRLHALPNQKDDQGRGLVTDLNVQGSMEMRETYPIGTIFGSESIVLKTGVGRPFYTAGDLYPVSISSSDLQNPAHRPTDAMVRDYNNYLLQNATAVNQKRQPQVQVPKPGQPLTLLDKMKLNPKYEIPTIERDGFWVDEDIWWMLMTNLYGHMNAQKNDELMNTMFTGPQGCGKTEIVKVACERLGLPLKIYDMGSMYDPISEMLGVHRINEKGVSEFDFASFTQEVQKEGVILLDELSRAPSNVLNILMPCLDTRRTLPVEMAGSKNTRNIKIHPKCHFVATANIGDEFSGTYELDAALEDRFIEVQMQTIPAQEEVNMLIKRLGIGKADAVNLVNVAGTIRSLYEKNQIHKNLSTRETIMAATKVAQGFSTKWAMEMIYLSRYKGTKNEGDKSIVWNAIIAR